MMWIQSLIDLLLVLDVEMMACSLFFNTSIDDNFGKENLLIPPISAWLCLALMSDKL